MKKKTIKKCLKNLINLNDVLDSEIKQYMKDQDILIKEQKDFHLRIQIIKKFLLIKQYSDGDFKEYLNQKLADPTSNIELKEQIKKYVNVLSLTDNLKGN